MKVPVSLGTLKGWSLVTLDRLSHYGGQDIWEMSEPANVVAFQRWSVARFHFIQALDKMMVYTVTCS